MWVFIIFNLVYNYLVAKDFIQTSAIIKSDKSERIPQRKDPVYKQYIREIGGRKGLRGLAMASANPKAVQLLELLDDESYNTWGVKKLLQAASITFNEALQLRDERSRNLAVSTMISRLPELAEDLVEDALTRRMVCPICQGNRVIFKSDKDKGEYAVVCDGCRGFGELVQKGDKDARQLVAKATKIIDDNPGVLVDARTQVNQVFQNPLGSSFEEAMKKAGKLITLTPRKVDNENSIIESELV
jgi:hypothetical protein